jgi:6-phosphogluconolactonase (cycloisomerase 2 family)
MKARRPPRSSAHRDRGGLRAALLAVATLALLPLPARAQGVGILQVVTDGVGGVDGLDGVRHVAVSPDGRHLYAAGNEDSAVAVFAIGGSGQLGFVQVKKDGSAGGLDDGLQNARHLAISPDGANVYVAAYNEFAASAFARDPASGALTFVNEVPNPSCCGVFTSLNEVAASPDGADIYTVSNGYAAALARGAGGALSLTDYYTVAAGSFGRGFAVAVSPDGAHVYVGRDASVEVTARSAGGALSFVASYVDGLGGVDGLQGVETIAVSPDGLDVYVGTSTGDRAIAHFWRDAGSGALTFRELYRDLDACPNPNELLFADDGALLIASCLTAVSFHDRDPSTGALAPIVSFSQQDLGATGLYSTAVSQSRETIYVASEASDSILVLPEPAGGSAAAAAMLGVLAMGRRRA